MRFTSAGKGAWNPSDAFFSGRAIPPEESSRGSRPHRSDPENFPRETGLVIVLAEGAKSARGLNIRSGAGKGVDVLRRQSHLFFGITVLLDVLCAATAWIATFFVRFHLGPFFFPRIFSMKEAAPPSFGSFAVLLPVVVACDLLALGGVRLYRPARTRSLMRECMRATKAAFLAWIGLLAVLYFIRRTPYSVKLVLLFYVANTIMLVVSRFFLHMILRYLHRRGLGLRRAAIIGSGVLGRKTLARLRKNPWVGIKVEYFVDADPHGNAAGEERREVHGVPVERCGEDFPTCLERKPVDAVFVAVPRYQSDRLDWILRQLSRLPVSVAVMPDFEESIRISSSVGEFEGMPIVELCDSPIYGWYAVAKRTIDIAVSLACLTVFALPMAFLALLIKLTSPGPVLFRQERMGLGGKPFTILKFRSMRVDAEKENGPVRATPNDERRTPLGRFMRRFSLDELPQFFNVLKGEMSLVGPRPERPYFVRKFMEELPAYMLRHSVKAGMTGWAQVNGLRGNTSIRERLQYDLYYINNWSLQFDLFILLVTPFSGLITRNAY